MKNRLRSDIWIDAIRKQAEKQQAFVHIVKRGNKSAGAIFIIVHNLQNNYSLYAPTPSESENRQFTCIIDNGLEKNCLEKLNNEKQFDPDIWIIEIEHKLGNEIIKHLNINAN